MMPQVTGIAVVNNTANHEFRIQHKGSPGTNYIGWSSNAPGTFNFNYICALEAAS